MIHPDKLRPYIGQWVAIRDGEVVVYAENPTMVVNTLRSRHETADAMFRVPVDPATDQCGH